MKAERHCGSYLFGGYLVTQRVPRREWMSAELLPAELLTASPCIASFVPDTWALDWASSEEERQRAANALGLTASMVAALLSHVTDGFNEGKFGWPNVVTSGDALTDLFDLLPQSGGWFVLGLGLRQSHVAEFLQNNAPSEGLGAGAVYEVVAKRSSLPPGG